MDDEYVEILDPAGFSRRLRALRDERLLSMSAFGDAVGRSRHTIATYESGHAMKISQGTLNQIAKTFGVTADYLLEGGGSIPEAPPDFRCEYNPGVDCFSQHCTTCGWNPQVAEKRKEAMRHAETERLLRSAWYYNG